MSAREAAHPTEKREGAVDEVVSDLQRENRTLLVKLGDVTRELCGVYDRLKNEQEAVLAAKEEVFELKQRLKAIELGARTPTGAAGPTVTSQKVPTRESAGRSSSTNDEGSTKLGENAALLRRGLEMEPPKRSSIDPPPTDAEISSMASFPRPGKQKDRVKQIRKAITDGPGRGPLTDSDYGRIVQLVRQVYKMVFLEGRGLVQPHHDLAVAFLEHKVPALRNCAEHWQAETLLANRIKSATDRLLSKHDSVTEPGSTSRRSTTRTPKHESASKLGLDGAAGMAVAGELSSLEVDPVVQGEDSGGTRLLGSALSPSRRSRSSSLSSPPSSPEARSPAGDRMKRRWSLAELDEEPDAEEDLGDDIPSRGQPIQYVPRRTRGTKRKVAFTRTTETDEATVPARKLRLWAMNLGTRRLRSLCVQHDPSTPTERSNLAEFYVGYFAEHLDWPLPKQK